MPTSTKLAWKLQDKIIIKYMHPFFQEKITKEIESVLTLWDHEAT